MEKALVAIIERVVVGLFYDEWLIWFWSPLRYGLFQNDCECIGMAQCVHLVDYEISSNGVSPRGTYRDSN